MKWSKEFQTTAGQDVAIIAAGMAVLFVCAFLVQKFSREAVSK